MHSEAESKAELPGPTGAPFGPGVRHFGLGQVGGHRGEEAGEILP